jgi:uncharacterized protein YqeY
VEADEIGVIEEFLPVPLSQEVLEAKVKEIIAQVGATSAADLGKVMGVANKALAGQVEGKVLADTIKSLLA